MKIEFEGLYDLKEFILMVDIYQFCDKEKAWGGLGYNIQNWYMDENRKEKVVVEDSDQSKVIHYGGGCIIVTPYYKMVSWLFNELRKKVEDCNYNLSSGVLLSGFSACCEEYFRSTPDHSAKELMVNILEHIQLKDDVAQGFYTENK